MDPSGIVVSAVLDFDIAGPLLTRRALITGEATVTPNPAPATSR